MRHRRWVECNPDLKSIAWLVLLRIHSMDPSEYSLNRLPSKYLSRSLLRMIKYLLTKLECSSRCVCARARVRACSGDSGITNCHQTICHQLCYIRHKVDKVISENTYYAPKDKMILYATKSRKGKKTKQNKKLYIVHLTVALLEK